MGMNVSPVGTTVFKIAVPPLGGSWVRLPGIPAIICDLHPAS
jgi:hypothetical protein